MSETAITHSLSDIFIFSSYVNAYEMGSTKSTIHKVSKTLKKTLLFSKQCIFTS